MELKELTLVGDESVEISTICNSAPELAVAVNTKLLLLSKEISFILPLQLYELVWLGLDGVDTSMM